MTVLTEVDKWRQRLTLSSKKRWDDYVPSHLKYSLSSYERPNLFLCCRDNLHKSGILVEKDRKQKNNNSNNKKVIGNIEGLPQWLRRWRICLQCRRPRFDPWVGKIWRRDWQPAPVFLPGEFHGQRSLDGYSPWGHKESDTTEWLTLTVCLQCCDGFRCAA